MKRNPELLIINPRVDDERTAWRKLRRTYAFEDAVKYYEAMYPKRSRKIKMTPGAVDVNDPEYKQALKLFRQFHGCDPETVTAVRIPEFGKSDKPRYFVVLGEAVAENYLTANKIKKSRKGKSVYVHPFESPEGELPLKVVSADGRLIMTLPGKHRVKALKGQDEAWIHH
jgi:hypothetical protein